MKYLALLFSVLFLATSCSSVPKTNNDIESAVIVYEANTKGYYGKAIIQNKTVTYSKNRNSAEMKTKKISDSDWGKLAEEFKVINLDKISNLEAPTNQRAYDGAAFADVLITHKGKEYRSSTFDHGKPPAEIKNFINKIVSYLDGN